MTATLLRGLADTQRAYLAAYIDGEGCLSYHAPGHMSQLAISSVDRKVLDVLYEWTGLGSIHHRDPRTPKHRAIFTWYVYTSQLRQLLEAVLPHLILKHTQALLILALRDASSHKKHEIDKALKAAHHGRSHPLIEEIEAPRRADYGPF